MDYPDIRPCIKIITTGLEACGKTLLWRVGCNRRSDFGVYEPTIGAAYFPPIRDSNVKIEGWDFSGLERYVPIANMHYRRGASVILICYDTGDEPSVSRARVLWDKVSKTCSTAQLHLVGCKGDTAQAKILAAADEFAREKNLSHYVTSAKFDLSVPYESIKSYFHETVQYTSFATASSVEKLQQSNGLMKIQDFLYYIAQQSVLKSILAPDSNHLTVEDFRHPTALCFKYDSTVKNYQRPTALSFNDGSDLIPGADSDTKLNKDRGLKYSG